MGPWYSICSWCDRLSDWFPRVDPLGYLSFHPMLHNWPNCKRPLATHGKSSHVTENKMCWVLLSKICHSFLKPVLRAITIKMSFTIFCWPTKSPTTQCYLWWHLCIFATWQWARIRQSVCVNATADKTVLRAVLSNWLRNLTNCW